VKIHRALALALLFLIGRASGGRADGVPRAVEITARRFEFVPSTITLRKGETVTLVVKSEDVIHGLFSRDLKIDTDIDPDKAQELTVTPLKAGKFVAICHHFCGAQHGNMKLTVVVEE